MRFLIWLIITAFAMEPSTASDRPALQNGQHTQPAAAPGDYPNQLFLPRGYLASRKQQWPLMIFLQGSDESGNDLKGEGQWAAQNRCRSPGLRFRSRLAAIAGGQRRDGSNPRPAARALAEKLPHRSVAHLSDRS